MAPGYRGKPEKFDPEKAGKKIKPKTPPRGPQGSRADIYFYEQF